MHFINQRSVLVNKIFRKHNTLQLSICVVLLFCLIYFYSNRTHKDKHYIKSQECKYFRPVFKIYDLHKNDSTLDIVKDTFIKMGYNVQHSDSLLEWDVLWTYNYPFTSLSKEFLTMKSHQKVNHFPGSGYITSKSSLITLRINNIPKSFIFPNGKEYFKEYAHTHTGKTWLLKNGEHRKIRLLNASEDVDIAGSFVQEFIQKPLLISGKKFDIGVYVVLTGIDPLRVYMYSGDILLRFCTEDYYPFRPNIPNSFIVSDDYIPVWKVKDLQFYYTELNCTAKESLNAYLKSQGKISEKLWSQIHRTIQNVYLETEEFLLKRTMAIGSLRNYFELVRFDFIADEELNAYLLEVNMSPNLSPAHFPENRLLYEQVLFNVINLVGLARKFHDSFFYRGEAEVSEKDIQVFPQQCASHTCKMSCRPFKCIICNQCMNTELKAIAKSAYLEFTNRGKFKKILPPPVVHQQPIMKTVFSSMNDFLDLWFRGKCLQDPDWCN